MQRGNPWRDANWLEERFNGGAGPYEIAVEYNTTLATIINAARDQGLVDQMHGAMKPPNWFLELEKRPDEAGELPDDAVVWSGSNRKTVHANPRCPFFPHNLRRRRAGALWDDINFCSHCWEWR